ncbi:MAG: hypothetical protein KAI81_09935, partial [Candidatus Marinimicrobia bacterium]|nr:hypothetical protein [Candidatus Neomarinimicrobiota bacterium]
VISEPDSGFSGTWEYEMNQSPVFRGGAAFFLKWVNLFYEAEVRNWSNLTFQSDLENLDNDLSLDPTLNQKIETELSPVLNHHFGAALHLPFLPLHLYGGYQILPDPYGDTAKHGISFGLSYLLQQQLSINAAYQKQYWEVDGIDQEWNQSTLSLNLHF